MNLINRFYIFCGALLLTTSAWALPQDKQQPIEISADRAEIDERTGTAIYAGNVKLTQGSLQLEADKLTLHTDERGDIRQLIAQGRPAHFQQQHLADAPITHGYGQTIEFDIQLDLLTLTEQARLLRAEDSFSGKRIQVDTTKNVIQAFSDKRQPDSRVQMVIQPRSKKTSATEEAQIEVKTEDLTTDTTTSEPTKP
jgi:lipopolysaccharide export system protein LptA